MVRLDAADLAVQSHAAACRLGAVRIRRRSADRAANCRADVFRAEHLSRQPLRRAGLRYRRSAWRVGWISRRRNPRLLLSDSMADYAIANPPYERVSARGRVLRAAMDIIPGDIQHAGVTEFVRHSGR